MTILTKFLKKDFPNSYRIVPRFENPYNQNRFISDHAELYDLVGVLYDNKSILKNSSLKSLGPIFRKLNLLYSRFKTFEPCLSKIFFTSEPQNYHDIFMVLGGSLRKKLCIKHGLDPSYYSPIALTLVFLEKLRPVYPKLASHMQKTNMSINSAFYLITKNQKSFVYEFFMPEVPEVFKRESSVIHKKIPLYITQFLSELQIFIRPFIATFKQVKNKKEFAKEMGFRYITDEIFRFGFNRYLRYSAFLS